MSTCSLSVLATYDELVRCSNVLVNGSCEGEFLQFAIHQEEARQKWLASDQECKRLHSALEKANSEAASLESKLRIARGLLDEEKRKRRVAEEQKNSFERQITVVRELLLNDGGRNLNDETREKLRFLNNTTLNGRNSTFKRDHPQERLNKITELDSTDLILSDLSCFSKSEDDLDTSIILQQNYKMREWKEHRPSGEYVIKKRRRSGLRKSVDLNNSDRIVATTTLLMPKEGTITASSVIEAIPADENKDPQQNNSHNSSRKRCKSTERSSSRSKISHVDQNIAPIPSAPQKDIISSNSDSEKIFKRTNTGIGNYMMNSKNYKAHNFKEKSSITRTTCVPCGERIRFGKSALKCADCEIVCHSKCKDLVPLPCILPGTIADYAPRTSPMVPALVVHCINEIELRGMKEQGLYRVPGRTLEAKSLKEKFLKERGAPNLSDVDIHTICSTIKEFLRDLKEPLITYELWGKFANASQMKGKLDRRMSDEAAIYQAISELPRPNRDTLAFLILHLKRVSESHDCQMPAKNLAIAFGPTLVGYSLPNPLETDMHAETNCQLAIVERFLEIPEDYWANFVNCNHLHDLNTPKTPKLRHTPSTASSSLKRSDSKRFFYTPSSRFFKKSKKYFDTPPSKPY